MHSSCSYILLPLVCMLRKLRNFIRLILANLTLIKVLWSFNKLNYHFQLLSKHWITNKKRKMKFKDTFHRAYLYHYNFIHIGLYQRKLQKNVCYFQNFDIYNKNYNLKIYIYFCNLFTLCASTFNIKKKQIFTWIYLYLYFVNQILP